MGVLAVAYIVILARRRHLRRKPASTREGIELRRWERRVMIYLAIIITMVPISLLLVALGAPDPVLIVCVGIVMVFGFLAARANVYLGRLSRRLGE